jgi:protein-tyrosine-phosphatase
MHLVHPDFTRSVYNWTMSSRPTVLFVCVHNAGRSQMAAALLDRAAHGEIEVLSAGSAPGDSIHDNVATAMQEVGIDLSGERPKLVTEATVKQADVVVTMGCGDACPIFPGKRYLDWDLPDPSGKPVVEVRAIRDEIHTRVKGLVKELLAPSAR